MSYTVSNIYSPQTLLFRAGIKRDPRKRTPKGYSRVELDVPEDQFADVAEVLDRKGYKRFDARGLLPLDSYIAHREDGMVRVEWFERKHDDEARAKHIRREQGRRDYPLLNVAGVAA